MIKNVIQKHPSWARNFREALTKSGLDVFYTGDFVELVPAIITAMPQFRKMHLGRNFEEKFQNWRDHFFVVLTNVFQKRAEQAA